MVLKPSEAAPLNAIIFAGAPHEAGVPPGVFNLVSGDGPVVRRCRRTRRFGGYKQSGNGREYANFGLEEFLKTKAVIGYAAA